MQIFYKNSTATKFPPLNIPGCGTKCPPEQLHDLYKGILPTQSFDKECAVREWETIAPDADPEIFTFH